MASDGEPPTTTSNKTNQNVEAWLKHIWKQHLWSPAGLEISSSSVETSSDWAWAVMQEATDSASIPKHFSTHSSWLKLMLELCSPTSHLASVVAAVGGRWPPQTPCWTASMSQTVGRIFTGRRLGAGYPYSSPVRWQLFGHFVSHCWCLIHRFNSTHNTTDGNI